MAKKGQVQLQTEVTNQDEWEKLLQKEGLILVDVYSEWCGPCQGMAANLKKIKLEVGGDMLQLATAKCDYIEDLKRFRNKSEPTWMFISNRKMVNLMFGADAPKLTRLLIAELQLEAQSVTQERPLKMEITDLADEEQVRRQAVENVEREAREKEEAKRAKQELDRKTEECTKILEHVLNTGAILVFPHARDKYHEALAELMSEASLAIQQSEKISITPEIIEELFFFADESERLEEGTVQELIDKQSLALLIHAAHGIEVPHIDEVILNIVYGPMRKPPGSHDSPAQHLRATIEDEETGGTSYEVTGLWVPPNPLTTATFFKLFFKKLTAGCLIPEPEPIPEHYAVAFDISKANNALQIAHKYPEEILRYGYFTSEVPEEATLVAKTPRALESSGLRTHKEKLILQVAKRKSECVLEFAQLGPVYMSPNVAEGKRECQIFFPEQDEPWQSDEDDDFGPEEPVQEEEEEQQPEEVVEDVDEEEEEEEEGSEDEEEEEDDTYVDPADFMFDF